MPEPLDKIGFIVSTVNVGMYNNSLSFPAKSLTLNDMLSYKPSSKLLNVIVF